MIGEVKQEVRSSSLRKKIHSFVCEIPRKYLRTEAQPEVTISLAYSYFLDVWLVPVGMCLCAGMCPDVGM